MIDTKEPYSDTKYRKYLNTDYALVLRIVFFRCEICIYIHVKHIL